MSLFLIVYTRCATNTENNNLFVEKYRPQYHFTPPSQWMNDPNGMVYFEGEYHLFYQYYPDSNVWGPMHWGHAVSEDMISWEHLPIALYPDDLGYIFSGSAVIDWDNTSGLGDGDNPTMVAIYTYHDPKGWESGAIDFQTQGIAYSNDKGRTWTKYEKNPVLPNPGIADFRDPKVMWHEPSQNWIMTLAVWDHVSFYSSPNLINWTFESDFGLTWGSHAGVWECPDLFEMDVEGSDEKQYVLIVSINPGGPQGGSATQYFIGDFDGSEFVLNEEFVSDLGTLEAYEPDGMVFEDFESGYDRWTATGDAFGDSPASGAIGSQSEVEGYEGTGLVNSFNGGDASTGTLTSEVFTIEKSYINLKVGGGNDNTSTYVALMVGDKEVRKAVGSNAEKLKIRSWDVAEFVGQEAQIKIVDTHKAGWGHVNVDQIEFSDEAAKAEFEKAVWIDYGADNYAGVTWSDIPEQDGRRLFIGWMSNWEYANIVPTYEWRSAMTLPRSLSLMKTEKSYRVLSRPVVEIENYIGNEIDELENSTYVVSANVTQNFEIKLSNDLGEEVVIKSDGDQLILDRSKSGIIDFSPRFGSAHLADLDGVESQKIQIFVDASSIEVFINDGELVMTDLVFPNAPYNKIASVGTSGIAVRSISSIWK